MKRNLLCERKKAPKGYRLDETVYPVTVVSGQTVSVNVKDVPVYSDMELILEKIDQEYKAGKSHGAGSLEVPNLPYVIMQAYMIRLHFQKRRTEPGS